MSAESSSRETGKDQIESLIDDLIYDILNEPRASSESADRGRGAAAAVFEQAFGSLPGISRAGSLEKLLFAEMLASELADAVASALAERLQPRLVKVLEQAMGGNTTARSPAPPAKSGGPGRKSGTR